MKNFMIANVAISSSLFEFDKEYSYVVPKNLENKIISGCGVLIPFGKTNRKTKGIVLSTCFCCKKDKMKYILEVLSEGLTDESLKLVIWIKNNYFCTFFDGVKLVLPNKILNRKKKIEYEKEKTSPKNKSIVLSDEQKIAFDGLMKDFKNKKIASLLYGVTGSGKTLIFIKIIKEILKENKSVIVMVPEIALTPQITEKFYSYFGNEVSVVHSSLSDKQRIINYKKIKNGESKVVIGTRSAVFAPVKNLGIIIIDEEHEGSYKSEQNPKYHTKEIALFRCKYNKALLILSSATPSMESFFNAKRGVYGFHTLFKRYGKSLLPKVSVLDMNKEVTLDKNGIFSETLIEILKENLKNKKQSILLLNRRGYNTFIFCPNCKEVITCKKCSISMTYHRTTNKLICHYCYSSVDFFTKCPICNTSQICFEGTGTQKIEHELSKLIKDAKILRIDTDIVAKKTSLLKEKLNDFKNKKYDIIVGTQMIAKGLDFENVTLACVVSADSMIYSGDFRGFEKTFSLITQVVGRSGRGKDPGRAIIQTYIPENTVIDLASKQDYGSFYLSELEIRNAMLYPPFVKICLILFSSKSEEDARISSKLFFDIIVEKIEKNYKKIPLRILGPSKTMILKVKEQYRYKIIIKYSSAKKIRELIFKTKEKFLKDKKNKNVSLSIDNNPTFIP